MQQQIALLKQRYPSIEFKQVFASVEFTKDTDRSPRVEALSIGAILAILARLLVPARLAGDADFRRGDAAVGDPDLHRS